MTAFHKTHVSMWSDPRYRRLSLGARNVWQIITQGPPRSFIPGVAVLEHGFAALADLLSPGATEEEARDYWAEIERARLGVLKDGPLIFCAEYAVEDLQSGGTNPDIVRGSWKRAWAKLPNVPLKAQIRRFFVQHFTDWDRQRHRDWAEGRGKEPKDSYLDAFEAACPEPDLTEANRRQSLFATLGLDDHSARVRAAAPEEDSAAFDASPAPAP